MNKQTNLLFDDRQDLAKSLEHRLTNVNNQLNQFVAEFRKLVQDPQSNVLHMFDMIINKNDRIDIDHTIYLCGIGKNIPSLRKASATFKSLGLKCEVLDAVDALHGDLGCIRDYDTVIFFSKSGNTSELLRTMQYLDSINTVIDGESSVSNKSICIDMFAVSMNSEFDSGFENFKTINHVVLPKTGEADEFNKVPTTSPIAFQIFLDMLACEYASVYDLTLEDFGGNHPGGDIGKFINKN
ncbi:gp212 [Sphingomonas phage PAU]|uniref:arabinose 5-phosphate isomerase n=1 Tax=Sphingomonas phage PAU TaxID=1150991 RepID=UPI0002573372|nr:arabinose 5-phosphate isomerase [Sphingomonas phage PAU]AFF28210.1 gp212 [Sphingomonas phage PAU]